MSLSIDVLTDSYEKKLLYQYYNSHSRTKRFYGRKISDSPIRYENEDKVFSDTKTTNIHDNPNNISLNLIKEDSNLFKTWICRGMNHHCECINCKLSLVKYFTDLVSNYSITNNTIIIIPANIISDSNPFPIDITLRFAYLHLGNYYSKQRVIKDLSSYNSCVYNPNRIKYKSCGSYIKNILESRKDYAKNLIDACSFHNVEIPSPDKLLCGSFLYRMETVTSIIIPELSKCIECPNTFDCFNTEIEQPCSICLSHECEFISSRPVKLDCGHTFHEGCLTLWFENDSYSCPLCRGSNIAISTELKIRNNNRNVVKNMISILQTQLETLDGDYSINI